MFVSVSVWVWPIFLLSHKIDLLVVAQTLHIQKHIKHTSCDTLNTLWVSVKCFWFIYKVRVKSVQYSFLMISVSLIPSCCYRCLSSLRSNSHFTAHFLCIYFIIKLNKFWVTRINVLRNRFHLALESLGGFILVFRKRKVSKSTANCKLLNTDAVLFIYTVSVLKSVNFQCQHWDLFRRSEAAYSNCGA